MTDLDSVVLQLVARDYVEEELGRRGHRIKCRRSEANGQAGHNKLR